MDDETISRVILMTIADKYATDESELISIADTLWDWCAGESDCVIEFTPEPKGDA